VQSNWSP